jgi:4,5-dihydroxyphthalate decarboxylase
VADIHLTLACGDYEIVRPLIDGTVKPDGIDLTILTDIDSTTRHWRFLRNREFEVAEVSASSYILARDAGYPFDAIPVFLHRRFRHEFVFVNTSKRIREPKDLIGRRIGVKSYQVSAVLWMRGILEEEYGVPHKSIHWFADLDEDVEFVPPPDLKLSRIPESTTLEDMLVSGELDAVIHADLIEPYVNGNPNVARLFDDYKAEEMRYFQKTGIFPIMHVMGIKRAVVEANPWVPITLYRAFDAAKAIAMERMFNPRIVPLAWYRYAWEEERRLLGPDPWEYGLTDRNRHTLETLVGYSHAQGMIKTRPSLDELFISVSEGRKRGTFRV